MNKWMSVKDEFPVIPKHAKCINLIVSVDKEIGSEALCYNSGFYWSYDDYDKGIKINNVTDWHYLTKPPTQ
jgi:hypothetical protein